jgi:Fe-S-cluster containining protein
MTECNGCGACCDPVITVISPQHLADGTAEQVVGEEEADWMRAHLTPILPRREGLKMVASWSKGVTYFTPGNEFLPVLSWFYRCDLYDSETRRCTDFENRPPMCRGYPWYDEKPDPRKTMPLTCSYRADIGEPVEDFT